MTDTKSIPLLAVIGAFSLCIPALASDKAQQVGDDVIATQRANLAAATEGTGFGPQSPRNIQDAQGTNLRVFGAAPAVSEMTLCDIHFHENAEHRGGQFTTFAGNGDGRGYGTGYKYDGGLSESELQPVASPVGKNEHGDLTPGDTIEIHFVFSTANATLGNGLGTCFDDTIGNPQLRVEAVIGVLVNDTEAADFTKMARIEAINGLNQVPGLPNDLGDPVSYAGSTTGPGFNEKASPFQVTWNVRPDVVKISISSVGAWLSDNPFGEDHAHGVRNLVTNPKLLSKID